jgi:hypothetical protein
MPGRTADTSVEIWYTEESGIGNNFGAGVYGPRDNNGEIFLWPASLQFFKLK